VHRVPVSLRVREAERAVVSQNPPPELPKPDPTPPPKELPKEIPKETPQPPPPSGTYGGPKRGNFTWVGELAAGQKLVITKDGVTSGGGSIGRGLFPGDVQISVEIQTQGIRVESPPSPADRFSRLVLVNQSAATISLVQVRWLVRE
jgi:hypothetical protein